MCLFTKLKCLCRRVVAVFTTPFINLFTRKLGVVLWSLWHVRVYCMPRFSHLSFALSTIWLIISSFMKNKNASISVTTCTSNPVVPLPTSKVKRLFYFDLNFNFSHFICFAGTSCFFGSRSSFSLSFPSL